MSSDYFYEFTDLFKQLYEVKGSKIVLKVREGDYEGVLKHVLPQSKRLVMNHVYFLPKREYMGTLNFFFREISSFSVLETAEEMEIGKPVKWDYISRILDGVSFGHTYSITDLFEELDEKTESDEDVPYPEDLEIDDFVLDLPSDLRIKLPQDNVIIDAVDSNFNLAIKHISQQKTIGVAFDGPKISRLGKLSWVCISSPCCLFLFDIHVLGKAAFDHGLRHIFQNKNIEKVIHDCREPSDCLFHLFDTKMVNVFDTQVADYVINTQRCVDKHAFKYVSSLDGCLVHYLNVPATYLHNREKYFSAEDEDIFYRVRPVSNDYRDVLIKNAVYLCLLKEELLELMLSPFRKSVDVYLNVLANASESELLLDISVPEKIPPALVMQGLQTVRFAEPKEFSVVPLVRNFIDLQKGTIVDMSSVTCVDAVKKDLDIDKQLSNEICSKKYNTKLSKTEFLNTQNTQKKSVIVEKMYLTNGKKHIDNVYHQLLNRFQSSDVSENVDVKPSQDYVSSFTITKSSSLKALPQSEQENSKSNCRDKNVNPDFEKCKFGSYETISGSSSDASVDSSSDPWAELRSAFSDSSDPELSRRNLRFIPAGM